MRSFDSFEVLICISFSIFFLSLLDTLVTYFVVHHPLLSLLLVFNFLTSLDLSFVHLEFLHRREAYTCWPQNTGAEQFNYGTRIDHILCAGSCLHQQHDLQGHDFMTCHVNECDILTQYRRWKPGNTLR